MFAFLPGLPGIDDVRALAQRVDTARHHGVPNGCVLEVDLMSVPNETGGFDPFALISGAGRPLLLREAVEAIHQAAEDDELGLLAIVVHNADKGLLGSEPSLPAPGNFIAHESPRTNAPQLPPL